MFQIGEVVIHKSAGACFVKDIITEDFGGGLQDYYYLRPKFENNTNKNLEIYLPVDKEQDYIRKPLSKEKVELLIDSIPTMEKIWENDAKKRKQLFEEIYYSGNIKGLCQLVKLLYVEPDFFSKPMSLTDKNFLLRIKSNIFDEFAVALNLLPKDIDEYIGKQLKEI